MSYETFFRPVLISKELADFTGWDKNKETSRVEVTKFLYKYIEKNCLKNSLNGRHQFILPDDKLRCLLKYDPEKSERLTYYSLQFFLRNHFQEV